MLYADLIYVDREEDGWYHFANKDHGLKNNKSGWVKTKFVEISPTDSKVRIDPEKMQVVYGSLNVRANPDLNSVRIGGLKKGDTFVATGKIENRSDDDEWCEWLVFTYKNQIAYILKSKQKNGKKEIFIQEESKANKGYEVQSVPVSVSSSVSIKRCIKPLNGDSIVEVVNRDNSQKETLGRIEITIKTQDGYSFPSDLSKINFDMGEKSQDDSNPVYYVKSVTRVKGANDTILVVLQQEGFCEEHGHHFDDNYCVDKLPTTSKNGVMSIHCKSCDLIQENTDKVIPRVKKTKIVAKSKASKKITVRWKKVSHAKGYEVKYSLGKKSKVVTVKSGKKLSTTLKKLKKGKTYKIKVRAYGEVLGQKYYAAWSTSKKVKVK